VQQFLYPQYGEDESLIFLKTHKTAGSTMSGVLWRAFRTGRSGASCHRDPRRGVHGISGMVMVMMVMLMMAAAAVRTLPQYGGISETARRKLAAVGVAVAAALNEMLRERRVA